MNEMNGQYSVWSGPKICNKYKKHGCFSFLYIYFDPKKENLQAKNNLFHTFLLINCLTQKLHCYNVNKTQKNWVQDRSIECS